MQRLLALLGLLAVGFNGLCDSPADPPTGPSSSPRAEVEWPGARTNGFVQLPNQWLLHPTGRQLVVGDFPINIAVHPHGKFAAVLHGGNGANEVIVFDIAKVKTVSRAEV